MKKFEEFVNEDEYYDDDKPNWGNDHQLLLDALDKYVSALDDKFEGYKEDNDILSDSIKSIRRPSKNDLKKFVQNHIDNKGSKNNSNYFTFKIDIFDASDIESLIEILEEHKKVFARNLITNHYLAEDHIFFFPQFRYSDLDETLLKSYVGINKFKL